MIRKNIIAILCCMASICAFSQQAFELTGTPIEWRIRWGQPIVKPLTPKSPIECPTVSIKDYTLFLVRVDYDLTLQVVDVDGDVVYSVFVPANTESVILPSTLVGDYELQVVPTFSNYYFVSDITL